MTSAPEPDAEAPPGLRPGLVTTAWARVLMGSLRAAGVTDVVVSPGSRNTPLTAATLADSGLVAHSVIDERAAGFFALGLARSTERPVALVCTSGTAGAHYLPALIEARHAGVPLLAITADRPLELQRSGANQTIDQRRLYGGIDAVDVGLPDPSLRALRGLRRTAARAVLHALSPTPGPVHLNVPLRKPLEPVSPATPAERALVAAVDGVLAGASAVAAPTLRPDPHGLDAAADAIRAARRGLIVAGPLPPSAHALVPLVRELSRRTGFPVAADATSQLRGDDLAGLHVFDPVRFRPDLVLALGSAPAATDWLRHTADPELRQIVLTDVLDSAVGWPDPHGVVAQVVVGDPAASLQGLTERLEDRAAPRLPVVVPAPPPPTGEAAVASAVLDGLPAGCRLILGNSLVVRVLDETQRALPKGVTVLSQRGVSGIDGAVASAVGATHADARPTLLVVGDVTLAHDLGSLQLASQAAAPLVVVVVDNGGGRIFDRLPIADGALSDADYRFWRTPPGVDFVAVAAALGWDAHAPDVAALAADVRSSLAAARPTLLHLRVG